MKKKDSHHHIDLSLEDTAQKLIGRVKAQEEVSEDEIDNSWKEVQRLLQPASRRYLLRRRFYAVASVAAVVALFFVLGFLFNREGRMEEDTLLSAALLNDTVPTASNEIVLIANNEKMHLQDEADLHYSKDGSLKVDSSAVESSTPRKEETVAEGPRTNLSRLNQIIVPKGRRANITFSDGSRIYINAGSRVVYPDVFAEGRRAILVEGEVYLEVSPDKHRPFIVKTKDFDVKVLGTTFNVCAYKDEPLSSVVLVEGSVEVDVNSAGKVKLHPNQLINVFNNQAQVEEVDVSEYICWKDNILMLNDRRVGEVLDRLARYYGVPVHYSPELYDRPISGKLDLKEKLQDVIDVICYSLSLNYTIDAHGEITVAP